MNHKISALLFAGLLGGSLLLGACAAPKAQTQTQAMQLTVGQMGTSVKPALVILAQERKLFEEEGLEVTLVPISNLNDANTALTEGKLDLLPYGMIPTCSFVGKGADLTVIGGTITGGSTCVALPERAAQYETLEGFRGKTVACVRPETGHMYMMGLLRDSGIIPGQDVTFVEMDSFQSVTEAVLKGSADVGFVNSFTQTAVKQGLTAVFDVADLAPDLVCCRQTTSGAVIREKREALVRFETGILRAYEIFLNDPDGTVKLLAAFSGQDADYTRNYLYNDALIVSPDPATDRVVEFYELMQQNGDIDPASPHHMRDHVDSSIYKDALDLLCAREPDKALWGELQDAYARVNQG